jgi:hypothetical protein
VTLSLSTSSLSCDPTLSNLHMQAAALSFPLANQKFGVVPQQAPPIPSDQVLRCTTTIYESSLAESVLLARGPAGTASRV